MSARARRLAARKAARASEPRLIYRVVPDYEGWMVRCSRFTFSGMSSYVPLLHCRTQSEAVTRARHIAFASHKQGWLTQLAVHGKDGRIRYEHTYGADPERSKG